MKTTTLTLALAAGALVAAGAAQAGDLAGGKGTPAAATAGAAAAAKPGDALLLGVASLLATGVKGYVVVSSSGLQAPNNDQVNGQVQCPAGTVPFGGGAYITSSSTAASINSSYPFYSGWRVDVNNTSGAGTTFAVYAICGKQPRKYQMIGGATVPVAAHSQTGASVSCTLPKVAPLGGGGYSDSSSPFTSLNGTYPTPTGWRIDANNGIDASTNVSAFAICGKLRHTHVVEGTLVSNPAGQQSSASISCDTGVPVSGGVWSSSSSPAVSVNTSYPLAAGWRLYVNNASGQASAFRPYVVCAG